MTKYPYRITIPVNPVQIVVTTALHANDALDQARLKLEDRGILVTVDAYIGSKVEILGDDGFQEVR